MHNVLLTTRRVEAWFLAVCFCWEFLFGGVGTFEVELQF
jgi:hypothetical protein